MVIRSPHDPEVPSSNPGKTNTSNFLIKDPLSLPSCDWYRIYLAMWWNSSVGRAAYLINTYQVISQMSRVRFPVFPTYLGLYLTVHSVECMCKHISVLNE